MITTKQRLILLLALMLVLGLAWFGNSEAGYKGIDCENEDELYTLCKIGGFHGWCKV